MKAEQHTDRDGPLGEHVCLRGMADQIDLATRIHPLPVDKAQRRRPHVYRSQHGQVGQVVPTQNRHITELRSIGENHPDL